MSFMLLILGFAFLIKGADILVDTASEIGRMLGIPAFVIGISVIAFGTSAPELVIGIFSGISKNNIITLGDVVGSSIANIGLVIGVIAMFFPLVVDKAVLSREVPLSFIVQCMLLVLISIGGVLSRTDGILLLVLFLFFLIYIFFSRIKVTSFNSVDRAIHAKEDSQKSILKRVLILIGSLVCVSYGGKLVVDSATSIAQILGMSDFLIGITIVAIGTSLPEFVTSLNAITKGKTDLSIGNIIGSNIFNILFVLGVSSTINPIINSGQINYDIYVMILLTILLYLLAIRRKRISIYGGITLLGIYIIYILTKFISL